MNITGLNSYIAFTRNPIVVTDSFPVAEYSNVTGKIEIVCLDDDTPVFSGCFTPPELRMDVSEALDSFFRPLPEPPENDTPVKTVCGYEDLSLSRAVKITTTVGKTSRSCQVTALPGGVPAHVYRKIGPNIFSRRFEASGCNFFMTTRTAGDILAIRETELYPLYFAAKEGETFSFTASDGNTYYFAPKEEYGIYALDLKALRLWFVKEKHILPGYLEIRRNGTRSCRIVITPAEPSRERYLLKYRNSYGVFEMMEIAGAIKVQPDFDGADGIYRAYDGTSMRFASRRGRAAMGALLSADTGIRHSHERTAFVDMLASEEIWLIGAAPFAQRVIPSAENVEFGATAEQPERFTLKLTVCDDGGDIGPIMPDEKGSRIFSKHFSKQFN